MVKPDTGQANFSEKMRRSGRSGHGFSPTSWRCALTGWSGARRVGELHHRQAVGELQRRLERIREPRRDVGPHHQAVDHHVDVVLELLVERRRVGDLVELAVDLDALVALLHELGELLAVLALAAAHHRRQQIEPRALGQRQHAVDHLRDGLALDRQAGRRRIGHADARPQQPHVVVDLGDGADGRARIARGGLLLDRDGGREAVDLVDVRLLHHLQELAGVGRQRLDVAALALGVDGVEGERGFARARQAGEHDQLVARDLDVDVLEIVLARAADRDHAGSVGSRLAARSALVEEVVHAVRRRSQMGEENVPSTFARGLPERSKNGGLSLVSRFRRSYHFAAPAFTNVGNKGTLASHDPSVALHLTFL